jgi:redox-sensitive bicupin YhaK (pirin superfamily)
MSNTEEHPVPVHCGDGDTDEDRHVPVEIITARDVPLGGPRAMTVHRTLPQRRRSLIGAWCFLDHYGPDPVAESGGMDVPPHPHTGLQTVSWLFDGEIRHDDSHGIHETVRPGEINLMTAGAGICHSEVSTEDTTELHGVQLWTVLPEHARHGSRRFDHYAPRPVPVDGGSALVFLGSLLGSTSPVPTFTPLVGAELRLDPGTRLVLPVDPSFEHGLLVDAGDVTVGGVAVARTELAYTGTGADSVSVENTGSTGARIILIGGEPFGEDVVMWWNFIGRDDAEIRRYREEWNSHSTRFGETRGYMPHDPDGPFRLPAPEMPETHIRPRSNPASVARAGDDPYRPRTEENRS